MTALAFTDDGAALLSGGEDTVVAAWLLMDVLDAAAAQQGQGGTPTFQAWCARHYWFRVFEGFLGVFQGF